MAVQHHDPAPQSTHNSRAPRHQPDHDPVHSAPDTDQNELLRLQQTIGNRALQRMLANRQLQAKLTVGAPDDVYEQEADEVAHQVMTMPDTVQREGMPLEDEEELSLKRLQREDMPLQDEEELSLKRLQREGMPLQDEEELLAQAKSTNDVPEVTDDTEQQINSMRGGGQSLPDTAREFFEPRFGQDFSGVNIHTGAKADTLNRDLSARAFTTGSDIFFRDGEYNPESSGGRELLAHELTHVVQQGGSQESDSVGRKIQRNPAAAVTAIEVAAGLAQVASLAGQVYAGGSGKLAYTSDTAHRLNEQTPRPRDQEYEAYCLHIKSGNTQAVFKVLWEGNMYGEIGAVRVRADMSQTSEFMFSSLDVKFNVLPTLIQPSGDKRTWQMVWDFEGNFDPAGNGEFWFQGGFSLDAFGNFIPKPLSVSDLSLIGAGKSNVMSVFAMISPRVSPIPALPPANPAGNEQNK